MVARIVSSICRSFRRFNMRRGTAFIFSTIGVLVFTSVVQAQATLGTPGVDYPDYFTLPETSFKCSEQKYNPGFYADLESKCQAFHFCYKDRQESFLCPTGTIFNQAVLTCDVWHKSNCSLAPLFYSVNVGPVMERAGKNLPMLLRLRNRSQNKPTQTSTTSVLDKVSSLYEANDETAEKSIGSDGSSESKAEIGDKSTDGALRDFDDKNSEQMISYDIKELESEKDAEKTYEAVLSNENAEIDTDEEMDTNIVYDPVTNGYYRNYDQYEAEWQDSEPASDEFNNFYDYRNTANNYGLAGINENELNYAEPYEDSDLTVENTKYPEFTKRNFQFGQSSQRVRRKPVYVIVDDIGGESENEEIGEKLNYPESSHTLANNDMREDKEVNFTSEESADTLDDYRTPLSPTYSQTENPDTSVQSEETEGKVSDDQGDDTIYIENDIEPESYVPYNSQYEDMVVVPEPGDVYKESYLESSDQAEDDSSDSEDTFIIPDEYDNVIDLEMPEYSEDNLYREMVSDSSPSAAYSDYESYRYSSSMDYPGQYEQTFAPAVAPELGQSQRWLGEFYQGADLYPEMGTGIYENIMTNDPRYSFQSGYDIQSQFPVNYESSSLDTENAYVYDEQYPYMKAELDVTDSPLELPVTEADGFLNEGLNEATELEQDLIKGPELDQPEDVYYVFDFDEQSREESVSAKDENMGLEKSSPEEIEHVERDKNKQLNSTGDASTSASNVPLDTDSERLESTKEEWSSDSPTISRDEQPNIDDLSPGNSGTTRDEQIKFPDVKSYSLDTNPMNNFNLERSGQSTPAHERSSSVKTSYASNMGNFDFSADSRFLNNMGYSESMDFGPYGFGSNMGQFSMLETVQGKTNNDYLKRISQPEQSKLSPLSAIQEKMRTMKQGKFGAFKKYISSNRQ